MSGDMPVEAVGDDVVAGPSLVERIAAGDRDGESEFVQLYRRGVIALVRRHCRPSEPAVDDLTQDVLIAVIEKLRSGAVRDPAALPGYVRSTAILTVQAEYRKRSRRGEGSADVPQEDIATGCLGEDSAAEDPEMQAHRQQIGARIRGLLSEMSVGRDFEILRRFYLLEHDREAICAALGIDEGHFRRVLFRARERFSELARRQGLEHMP